MPNDELTVFVAGITRWIAYYEGSYEASSYYESKCPDHVRDNPEQFYSWISMQREKEKQKMKSGR